MNHIMIDLETLGIRPDAAILSIGAVFFDIDTGKLGDEFEVGVRLIDDPAYGHIDPQTIGYWLSLPSDAQAEMLEMTTAGLTLKESLNELAHFFQISDTPDKIKVWANGASFDPVVVESACRRCGLPPPWSYNNLRDVRTLVDLGRDLLDYDPKHNNPFDGTQHNALADAIHQARYVSDIYRRLKRCSEIKV